MSNQVNVAIGNEFYTVGSFCYLNLGGLTKRGKEKGGESSKLSLSRN